MSITLGMMIYCICGILVFIFIDGVSILHALDLSVSALTSVGSLSVYPTSTLTKLFCVIYYPFGNFILLRFVQEICAISVISVQRNRRNACIRAQNVHLSLSLFKKIVRGQLITLQDTAQCSRNEFVLAMLRHCGYVDNLQLKEAMDYTPNLCT